MTARTVDLGGQLAGDGFHLVGSIRLNQLLRGAGGWGVGGAGCPGQGFTSKGELGSPSGARGSRRGFRAHTLAPHTRADRHVVTRVAHVRCRFRAAWATPGAGGSWHLPGSVLPAAPPDAAAWRDTEAWAGEAGRGEPAQLCTHGQMPKPSRHVPWVPGSQGSWPGRPCPPQHKCHPPSEPA